MCPNPNDAACACQSCVAIDGDVHVPLTTEQLAEVFQLAGVDLDMVVGRTA